MFQVFPPARTLTVLFVVAVTVMQLIYGYVLPLEQSLAEVFILEWISIKCICNHSWLQALWVNVQIFTFLFVCLLFGLVLGPIGVAIDLVLLLSAFAYSMSGEA
jgi:hypothetical protein